MSGHSDDDIVLTEGPATRASRFYHWVIDHLAKFPGRVTIVTFVAGVVVTVVVALLGGDESPTTVVGLVATLWALFFAVMIYLLTARDTDRVLDQIAELRGQLATALSSPDEAAVDESDGTDEAAGTDGGGIADEAGAGEQRPTDAGGPAQEPTRVEQPGRVEPMPRPLTPAPEYAAPNDRWAAQKAAAEARARSDRHPIPHMLVGAEAIADGVPADLIQAWVAATGHRTDELTRAWSRDPRSDRQWVLETAPHERWVVFPRGEGGTGVISLSEAQRRRGGHPGRR